ncbi:MAG: hypothetical protein MHMPM18_001867 [Marteilia pararefringens]
MTYFDDLFNGFRNSSGTKKPGFAGRESLKCPADSTNRMKSMRMQRSSSLVDLRKRKADECLQSKRLVNSQNVANSHSTNCGSTKAIFAAAAASTKTTASSSSGGGVLNNFIELGGLAKRFKKAEQQLQQQGSAGSAPTAKQSNSQTECQLNDIMALITSDVYHKCLTGVEKLQRILLDHKGPKYFDTIISMGFLPHLAKLLQKQSSSQAILYNVVLALTNLSSSTVPHHCQEFMNCDLHNILISRLKCADKESSHHIFWILSNLAGDNVAMRDKILKSVTLLDDLHSYIEQLNVNDISYILNILAFLSNLSSFALPDHLVSKSSQLLQLIQLISERRDARIRKECLQPLYYLAKCNNDLVHGILFRKFSRLTMIFSDKESLNIDRILQQVVQILEIALGSIDMSYNDIVTVKDNFLEICKNLPDRVKNETTLKSLLKIFTDLLINYSIDNLYNEKIMLMLTTNILGLSNPHCSTIDQLLVLNIRILESSIKNSTPHLNLLLSEQNNYKCNLLTTMATRFLPDHSLDVKKSTLLLIATSLNALAVEAFGQKCVEDICLQLEVHGLLAEIETLQWHANKHVAFCASLLISRYFSSNSTYFGQYDGLERIQNEP